MDIVKKYAAAILPTAMYFFDAVMDSSSSYDFCTDGQTWWCALSAGFIIGPEIVVSAFIAYKIWRDREKTKEEAKKEDFAIIACFPAVLASIIPIICFIMVPTMVLPFAILPWLTYKALQDEKASKESSEMILKTQITMIQLKGLETLLQSGPQLSLKSYIVIHKLHCMGGIYNDTSPSNLTTLEYNFQNNSEYCQDVWDMEVSSPGSGDVGIFEIISPFGTLCSLCFSIASLVVVVDENSQENSDVWYRKTVWFIALLGSIGPRMMACGVLASWNQALWIVPPVTACVLVLAVKKLRYTLTDTDKTLNSTREALKVVLDEGLLLAYPSPEGLLASASYIGWTVWFYLNGTLIDGGTNTELGLEALSTCIVGQGFCLIVTFIALRLGYETPDILPVSSNKTPEQDSTDRI